MKTARAAQTWINDYGGTVFKSWDFYVAAGCGGLAVGLFFLQGVRQAAVPILITEAAIGVALTSTVFGAVAVFATFYDGSYRRVLELAGGLRSALMPFVVVGVVAASAGVVGVVAALALPALALWLAAVATGAATLLCVWALTGTVSLIELTLFHAGERARLMAGADATENIRAHRLRSHSERTAK